MAFKRGIFPTSAINGAGPADFGTFNEIITHQSVNQIRDVLPGADLSEYNSRYKGWWNLSALGDLRWHLTYRKGVGDTTIQFPIRTETLVSSDIQHFKNMMYWGMTALDPHAYLRPQPLKLWNTLSGQALPNSYIDYKAMNNMHWVINGVTHKVREFYVDANMQYVLMDRIDNGITYLLMYSATASAAGAGWPEANQVWWMKNDDRANSVKLNGDIGFPDKPPLPTLMVEDDYVVAATRTGQVPEGYYSDGDNHNLKMATLTSVSTGKKWYVGAIGDSSADDKGWGFTRAFLGRMCMVPEPKTWGPISTQNLDEVFEVQDSYTYPLIRRSHLKTQVIFNGHTPTKSIKWGRILTLRNQTFYFNTGVAAAGIQLDIEYISDWKLRCHLYLLLKDEYGNNVTIDHGTREISEPNLSYNTWKTRSFSWDFPDVTINGHDYIWYHRGQKATNMTFDLQFHWQRSGYIGVGERTLHIGNQRYFNGDDDSSFYHSAWRPLEQHPNNMSGMWRGYFGNIEDTWFERK